MSTRTSRKTWHTTGAGILLHANGMRILQALGLGEAAGSRTGGGGNHDRPYTWSSPPLGPHVLAWTTLRALRERGEFEP